MGFVILYIFVFVLGIVSHLLVRKNKGVSKKMGKEEKTFSKLPLPPGSMGWPYLGETHLLYSQDPNVFFASKQKRYGEIFKTHVLGYPCVMLASPEAAKFVLVTQAHLFKPTYPRSKERMIGPWALFFHEGDYHAQIRKLVQGSLAPKAISRLIPDIEAIVVSMFESWDGNIVHTFHGMKKFSFDVGILTILGSLDSSYKEELKKNYFIVDKGYNSFPVNMPGTPYNKAVQARKRLGKILSEIVLERRRQKGKVEQKDLLGCFMSAGDENSGPLTDDQIVDNIIGVLFAAQDTTASVLTWILKYLNDDPKLLEAVKAEQMAVYEANGFGSRPLTWCQTRNMPLTHRVILESLRMASIISFTFREAVADVEYKGYLIPKGWKVMPLFRNIHHNPEFFQDPQQFDASRFEATPKPNTLIPFGTGVHACPGNELAKLEMLIVIHHLVTKYRWKAVGPQNGAEYSPFPVPKLGLPIRFWKETNSSQRHQQSQ